MYTSYETDRLSLRILTDREAGLVTDFYSKNFNDFSLYEPLPESAKKVSYHKKNLAYEYNMYLKSEFIRFFIFEKHNPMTVIGTVSYRDIIGGYYKCATIGYKMDASMRRRGYCREAINFLDGEILEGMNLNRIEATVRPENIPSQKLLESIGYINEGLLREKIYIGDSFKDHYLYALLKRDYKNIY